MEFLSNDWFNIMIVILGGSSLLYIIKREREKDSTADYDNEDIRYEFIKMPNGETWLMFKYDKMTQPKKKEYILNYFTQDMEVSNDRGYKYIISELISYEYYDKEYDSEGKLVFKEGPYIAFKVIPITERTEPSRIHVKDTNGPVQIVTGGSEAYQHVENSTFSTKIEDYKELMIENGISEEDINIVINNPNNEYVKKSFLSKYGLELAKISVNVAGVVVNLLKLFQS